MYVCVCVYLSVCLCWASGYTQTAWSLVELRCGTLGPGGDNSPKWDRRSSLMSPGTLAPVEVLGLSSPSREAWSQAISQASDLQAKLLPSYLATVKSIKRAVQPPHSSLTPLSLYISLLSPLPFLYFFFFPLLSPSFSLPLSLQGPQSGAAPFPPSLPPAV